LALDPPPFPAAIPRAGREKRPADATTSGERSARGFNSHSAAVSIVSISACGFVFFVGFFVGFFIGFSIGFCRGSLVSGRLADGCLSLRRFDFDSDFDSDARDARPSTRQGFSRTRRHDARDVRPAA
jgi:hypothetical protein